LGSPDSIVCHNHGITASTGVAILDGRGLCSNSSHCCGALDVRDEVLSHCQVTVRFFFAGIVIVIIGATISSIVMAIEATDCDEVARQPVRAMRRLDRLA
jgi:hypothetical protein